MGAGFSKIGCGSSSVDAVREINPPLQQADGSSNKAKVALVSKVKTQAEWISTDVIVTSSDLRERKLVHFMKQELEFPRRAPIFDHLISSLSSPIFQQAGTISMIVDNTLVCLAISSKGCAELGYLPVEIIGRNITMLMTPEIARLHENANERSYRFDGIIEKMGYFAPQVAQILQKGNKGCEKVFSAQNFVFPFDPYFIAVIRKVETIKNDIEENVYGYMTALKQVPSSTSIAKRGTVTYFDPEMHYPSRQGIFGRTIVGLNLPAFNKPGEFAIVCNPALEVLAMTDNFMMMTHYNPMEVLTQKITMFMTPAVAAMHKSSAKKTDLFQETMKKQRYFKPIRTDFITKGIDRKLMKKNSFPANTYVYQSGGMDGKALYYIALIRKVIDDSIGGRSENLSVSNTDSDATKYIEAMDGVIDNKQAIEPLGSPTSGVARPGSCPFMSGGTNVSTETLISPHTSH